MAGEKLKLVKETMHFVVKQLTDLDRLGVIAYDDSVTISLELTNMNANGKQKATDAINSIYDGGTNLFSPRLIFLKVQLISVVVLWLESNF